MKYEYFFFLKTGPLTAWQHRVHSLENNVVRYEDGEHTIHSYTLLRTEEGAITKNTTMAMIHHKKASTKLYNSKFSLVGPHCLVGWLAECQIWIQSSHCFNQRPATPLIERLDFCGSTSTVIPRQLLQQTRVFFLRSFQPSRQHSSPAEKDENLEG